MVISSSSWVRPAQAIIYTESGEMKFFPPRNKGNLPRALTFRDKQDWKSESSVTYMDSELELHDCNHNPADQQRLNKTDVGSDVFSSAIFENDEISFQLVLHSPKYDIDDPPEEYESFEHEYSQCSLTKESPIENQIHSMSTPTEQYTNILRQKRMSVMQPYKSPYLQRSEPDSSDYQSCSSPLLHTDPNIVLTLDELVELHTQKLEQAKINRLRETEARDLKLNANSSSSHFQDTTMRIADTALTNVSIPVPSTWAGGMSSKDAADRQLDPYDTCTIEPTVARISDNKDFPCNAFTGDSFCSSLQLMAFDIQLLLQKLDLIDSKEEITYEELMCISPQELESLLFNCCRKTMEFVMMD